MHCAGIGSVTGVANGSPSQAISGHSCRTPGHGLGSCGQHSVSSMFTSAKHATGSRPEPVLSLDEASGSVVVSLPVVVSAAVDAVCGDVVEPAPVVELDASPRVVSPSSSAPTEGPQPSPSMASTSDRCEASDMASTILAATMKRAALGAGLSLTLACAPGGSGTTDVSDDASAGTSGTSAASSEATVASASTTAGEATLESTAATITADSTAGPDDTGEPLPPPPATGIQIVDVTADQGMRIPVAREGAYVDPSDRNAAVLQSRVTAIRAFYATDPGFAARPIYGVLWLDRPDGTSTRYEAFVSASEADCSAAPSLYECRYGEPDGALLWRVEGEDIVPGVQYRIELYETAPGHEDDPSEASPLFPTDGSAMELGVAQSYMKMRVVVVPYYHDAGPACLPAPDLAEEHGTDVHGNPRTVADLFRERLYAYNPVDEVEIIVHDVVSFNGNASQGQGLLEALQQLRFQEDAPPEHYYYGVIRPCQGAPEFSGIAQLGGPSPGQAAQRVGWGVYHASPGTTADTFVHEIGHEQGRFHIACTGTEGGPDVTYPDHPEGDTESWGIDVMLDPVTIKPPGTHEYMSYCGTNWVSQWGWDLVSPWIEELSSWERVGAPGSPRPLLVGTVEADGRSRFYVTRGWFDEALVRPGHTVRFLDDGAAVAELPAQWVPWERSDAVNVIVPLPTELAEPSALEWHALEWHAPDRHGTVDRASVRGASRSRPADRGSSPR